MKPFGLAFLITGIFLISLSGLEKIIIYISLNERAGDYQSLKIITPNEIWDITKMTFIFGILIFIIGLIMSLWKFIVKQMVLITEANRQFQIEHGFNRENKEQ
ncbi:hypothetical protein [Cohnella silvisoli]|uniref:DUF3169 family protein n=1 Tax=Cohnella silvisoli TaxID=2873699 RepID=A0ABV1L1L7_9BACL|nr:hypothetical protein [Cohnella silvisoli]MCD9025451.1 hypothetical protein [Cohnella silvisoli]